MFVSWAFGGAIMPWLSRHSPVTSVPLSRGYELGAEGAGGDAAPDRHASSPSMRSP